MTRKRLDVLFQHLAHVEGALALLGREHAKPVKPIRPYPKGYFKHGELLRLAFTLLRERGPQSVTDLRGALQRKGLDPNSSAHINGAIVEWPFSGELSPMVDKTSPSHFMAPGDVHQINGRFHRPLTEEIALGVLDGSIRIVFWGEITYRDAFGGDRYVRFRYQFGGDSARLGRVEFSAEGTEAN